MATFNLEVYTPYRQLVIGQTESLVLPILDGAYGVQAGHEPVVTAIVPGELRYQTDGEWHIAAVGSGFAEIMPDQATLLVSFAERPEEIDLKRAQAAYERAQERLRQKASNQEYHRSEAALARAMARLKTVRDSRQ